MADRVIQRNDTAARWQSVNPVLATGEIGIEIDGAKGYKIGDGKTRWNDLPYPANPTNVVQELGNNENAVPSQKLVTEKLSELGSEVENVNLKIGVDKYIDAKSNYMDEIIGLKKGCTYIISNLGEDGVSLYSVNENGEEDGIVNTAIGKGLYVKVLPSEDVKRIKGYSPNIYRIKIQQQENIYQVYNDIRQLNTDVSKIDLFIGREAEFISSSRNFDEELYLKNGCNYKITNIGDSTCSFYSVNENGEEDGIVNETIGKGLSVNIAPTSDVKRVKGYSSETYKITIIQEENSYQIFDKVVGLENNMLKSNRTSLSLSDLSWENGHISDDGKNSTYDAAKRLRSKGYVYLKAGDCFRLDASVVNRSYIFYYNEDLSFDTSTSHTEKLYSIKSGFARILLIPKTDSIVGLSLLEYVNYIPYNYGNRISVEDIDSRLANIDNSNDFGWENGHINSEGYNASYDDNYRIRSKMMYVKKGDIISLIRTFRERYIIFYYNDDKTLKKSTDWIVNNTRIEEDGFVRILMSYENNGSWGGIEMLASSLSVVKNGEYDNCNVIEWELGGVKGADGSNYSSDSSMRTKNIIHVKAGTIIVPYVFGRYLIAYYDEDGNFIKRMPNDGEGEHNDGYYSQNAFEFTEDANVRFVLFWMSASTFYKNEGFEHIIPNTTENLPLKFRIIPPKYEMPYYIKKVIDDKNVEIISLGDMFRLTFLTDPHEYFYHEMAAVYCAEKNCNFLVNGGDLHSWPVVGNSTVIKTVNRHMDILVKSSVPVVMTKGNHESCLSGGNDYSTEMWYSQTQKQLRKIDYQYDGTNETLGYFFVDDEKNKVRLICLNIFVNGGSHLIGSQQRIWLMNVALDLSSKAEDEKNWSVIAVGHSQIVDNVDLVETTATMEEDWVARVFRGAYNKTKTDLNSERFDFSIWTAPDFSNIKYQFVAYICGHSHYDNVSRIMDFPHITTACAHPLENEDKYRRVWDSVEEYAFDVFCLDTKNRNLIIKRIGVGSDREVSY